MKSLDTLRDDMYAVIDGSLDLTDEEIEREAEAFGVAAASALRDTIKGTRGGYVPKSAVRLSRMGVSCDRKLWYEEQNTAPDEPLLPSTRIKFFYGHLLEGFLCSLVRLSGHDLSGEQDEVSFGGVVGHRDGIIDGRTIDFKSASTFSFQKQKDGKLYTDDPFGYLTQLWSYDYGSEEESNGPPAIISIDKQHGHISVKEYPATKSSEQLAKEVGDKAKAIVGDHSPDRCIPPVPDGKSGNMKLDTVCSYCEFKHRCWPDLRTFLYANGPRYLVDTVKEPNVPELVDGEIKRKREEF